ncbi:MAG: Sua5 family C-terminal domain-containing protein, partial [Pseudomonadota bacterium]
SPTSASDVFVELGDKIPLILDGGNCSIGIESSVIDLSEKIPCLLRSGFITKEQIEEVLGYKINEPDIVSGEYKSPGMLLSHYAPNLPLRLNASNVNKNEGLLAFGDEVTNADIMLNLSDSSNLEEAATNLFAYLRRLDNMPEITSIAVMKIPDIGIGRAINDRLKRAASR